MDDADLADTLTDLARRLERTQSLDDAEAVRKAARRLSPDHSAREVAEAIETGPYSAEIGPSHRLITVWPDNERWGPLMATVSPRRGYAVLEEAGGERLRDILETAGLTVEEADR